MDDSRLDVVMGGTAGWSAVCGMLGQVMGGTVVRKVTSGGVWWATCVWWVGACDGWDCVVR